MVLAYLLFGFKVTDIEPLISPEEQWKLGQMALILLGAVYTVNFVIMSISTF